MNGDQRAAPTVRDGVAPGIEGGAMLQSQLEHAPEQRPVLPPALRQLLEVARQVDVGGRHIPIPKLAVVVRETGVGSLRKIEVLAAFVFEAE
jgi:hypothetical protein